jgi:iron complex outermembrane receptor protein
MATDSPNDYWFYQNKGVKTESSIFTKIHYNLGSKFIAYGDIQYRNVNFIYQQDALYSTALNPVYWNFINPKGGLRFNQSKKISHYTSIGLSHREPTRNDLFSGYDDVAPINDYQYVGFGVDTIDIRTIKPERVVDLELGSELRTNKLSINANVYYMNFKNEIAPIGRLSYIGLPLRKNVKSSFRSGVEIDATYRPIKNIAFRQSFSYSYNRIRQWSTDDSIPQVYNNVSPLLTPNIISNTSISFNWKIVTIGLSSRYISSSYLDNTMNSDYKTPDYLLIDGSIGIDYKSLSIRTMINNITGVRYFTSGYVGYNGVTTTPAYFIGAPRNIYVTISLKF